MNRLFATLFTVYVLGTILVAIVRRSRTGPGQPTLPPVAHPDRFPWEPLPESDAPRQELEPGEVSESIPELQHPMDANRREEPEPLIPVPPEPLPPEGGAADRRTTERSLTSTPAAAGASVPAASVPGVRLTPATVRHALIVSELLAPPRALRPYRAWPRRRL